MKTNAKYLYFLVSLYFIVSLIGILHHELWLDEAHHWLLARDSHSIADLAQNIRREGHPILWSLMLYGVSCLTSNLVGMQLLHIIVSTATVFVFLKKAPFSWLFKTIFIFGYFMVFEYNLISRNYILGVFFLFLACDAFKEREKKSVRLLFFLAMAANVHLLFGVIAFALFLTVLWERFQDKTLLRNSEYVVGYAIFGCGIGLLAYQILNTDSVWFFDSFNAMPYSERFTKGFISLFKGLVMLPNFTSIHFWNTNLIIDWSKPIGAVLGLLVYALPLLLFFKNRKTLFFVYTALIGTQVFFFVTQRGAARFDGLTYLILISALWIENYFAADHYKLKEILSANLVGLLKKPIVYGILCLHLLSGMVAYVIDWNHPFTNAEKVADYLKARHLDTKALVAVTCDGTIISAYVQKKIWFLCEHSYQSYCHWDFDCARQLTQNGIRELVADYMADHDHAVFVSYYPIVANPRPEVWQPISATVQIRFLQKFEGAIANKDRYYVFEMARIKS